MLEADLKRAVKEYLQYKMNLGELYFDQLFSGEAIEVRGNTRRKIQGCRKGTADFFVILKETKRAYPTHVGVEAPRVIFLELKGDKGRWPPEQRAFKILVESQGAEYYLVRSVEELEEVLG